ncbi:MAG: TrkA C-terminal domain-containing protein [Erysipelotrichaceae bacterium]|nr:TrkA C-terminal domain-containing protein [Erysipelotrichaceae bacterium]MBQ1483350.1 TrkA C-terminal domain-containing protein [Erysipelotrichaceae bacterium]
MTVYSSFILFAFIIVIYLIIAEIFTILFRFTGLDREKASFQVISLLTGCGFTTGESELVTSSRQRRRLAKITMMFGYVFNITFVSAFVNIFLSFKQREITNFFYEVALPIGIFVIIILAIRIPQGIAYTDKALEKIIGHFVKDKNFNPLTVIDTLGGKTLASIRLQKMPADLIGKKMSENGLRNVHSIIVLLVESDDGTPNDVHADTILKENDRITVLGDYNVICNVFKAKELFVEAES